MFGVIVLLLVVLVSVQGSFPTCPRSCVCRQPYKRYSVGYPLEKVTWDAAKQFCEREGKMLATVKNYYEQNRLEKTMEENGLANENVWLGLSICPGTKHFRWVDGTFLDVTKFENWKPGEPNNFYYPNVNVQGIENCVQVNGQDQFWPNSKKYQWNDVPCNDSININWETHNYIVCEYHECF